MSSKVRVQALCDVQFLFRKDEIKEYSPTDARALVALKWVKPVTDSEDTPKRGPGRPRKNA